jgi:tetratricopeptide (TPR) repeat protein
MRRFNTRLFLWLLGIMAAATAVVFLVHYLQTGRIAQALLWQAHRAEEQGKLDETTRYLGRYLEFMPNDHEQRANLGRILAARVLDGDRARVSYRLRQQALFVLDGVVANDPGRQDLRRRLAQVALDLDRADVAEEHLQALHAQLPDDGEVTCLLAQCRERQKAYAEAALLYWEAVRHAPHYREGYVRLAVLLGRPDRADWSPPAKDPEHVLAKKPKEVLDLLVANNADSYQAHLARWWSRHEEAHDPARRAEVGGDVREALRLAPTEAEVLLAAADLARAENDLGKARAYLRQGRELHGDDRRLHLALADVELTDSSREPQVNRREAVARLNEGLQTVPENTDLLWLLANVLLDGDQADEADQVVARMRKANGSPTGIEYLRARGLCVRGRWVEASRLLESTRPVMERDGAVPGLLDQVDLYLATCYAQTDEPGQELAAFERVIGRHGPTEPVADALLTALRGRAETLGRLGRLDEAVTQYEDLLRRPGAPKGTATELAQLVVARSAARGQPGGRDVDAALDRAARAEPDNPDVALLRARVLLLRKEADGARSVLEKACGQWPKKGELWAALIELAQARKQPQEAARLLKKAEEQAGDCVALRLARARVEPTTKHFATGGYAEGRDRFSAEDQATLLRGLMEIAYERGETRVALDHWKRLAGLPQHRHDARVKLVEIELAVQIEDESALTAALADVRHLEGGEEGPLWGYGEALRLLRGAGAGRDPAALDRAAALLERVAVQRPSWVGVRLAQADAEKRRHNPDAAAGYYQKALELNDGSPRVLRELAGLLLECGREDEAREVLRRLPQQARDEEARWLEVDLASRSHDPARAAELALGAVAPGSTDYRDYLRLGAALAGGGRHREAEQDLRRATDLGGDHPETWVALVRFLASTGRADEARRTVETARGKVPADQAPLALARCSEALGDTEAARRQYAEAVRQRPRDFATAQAAALFYLHAGLARDAETLLRPLATGQGSWGAPESAWARRRLALLLAAYPDEQHFADALALVGLKLTGGKVTADGLPAGSPEEQQEEVRTRAQVLASRDRRLCRAQAVAFLEDLARRGRLTADDKALLARLYEAGGSAEKARGLLLELATNHADNPAYLDRYARSLLRQGKAAEAAPYVDRLEKLEARAQVEPGTWGSVELRAELLEARGQGAEALSLLRGYARRRTARPEDALLVIGSLSRQQKFAEALDACDEAWRTCPAALAGQVSLAVLRAGKPTAEQCARVERRLKDASTREPNQPGFLLYLADLYDLREDYAGAVDCYRRVLVLDRENVVALNNLAWLLVQTSDQKDEAAALIQQAIDRRGGRADLLDTRAAIELARSQTEEAIRDLQLANADQPTASRYFRLSLAYRQAKDAEAARTAWQRAKALGLKPEQLHPIEQTALRKVTSELEPH